MSAPTGAISEANFQLEEEDLPELQDEQVLVRSECIMVSSSVRVSSDPRGLGGGPAAVIGSVPHAFATGRVLESRNPRFKAGDLVSGFFGWQDHVVNTPVLMPPAGLDDAAVAVAVQGPNAMAAYFGLLEIGQPKPGETVVVSGAAGGCGQIVGQIARIKGCRVVGIAGPREKCDWLVSDLGFDAAVSYRSPDFEEQLVAACPKGIDVFFDNVGGAVLDVAFPHIADRARIVCCGTVSTYDLGEPVRGPVDLGLTLTLHRAKMEGFLSSTYRPRFPDASAELVRWYRSGDLRVAVHEVPGFERLPEALSDLLAGKTRGQTVVRASR